MARMSIATSHFLVSTSKELLILDKSNMTIRVIHEGAGLYYGIAADSDHVYVAARRNRDNYKNKTLEKGVILVFNKKLTQIDTIEAPFPLRDLHGIAMVGRNLWITCTGDNFVGIFNRSQKAWQVWHPLPNKTGSDINHFNTVAFNNGRGYLIAHNFGISDLFEFNPETKDISKTTPLGLHSHSLLLDDKRYYCDSARGLVRSVDSRFVLRLGGFTRGIAATGNELLVGISEIAERHDRNNSSSHIAVTNRTNFSSRYFRLPGRGMITEIFQVPMGFLTGIATELLDEIEKTELDFTEQKLLHDNSLKSSQWHDLEEFRWMANEIAEVSIWIDGNSTNITINGYSGCPAPYSVDIHIGDKLISRTKLATDKHFTIEIDISFLIKKQTQATLKFRVPFLWSPEKDIRELGIAVRSIRYN